MKSRFRVSSAVLWIAFAVVVSDSRFVYGQATLQWIAEDGSWVNAENWDLGFAPRAYDTARISNGGTASLCCKLAGITDTLFVDNGQLDISGGISALGYGALTVYTNAYIRGGVEGLAVGVHGFGANLTVANGPIYIQPLRAETVELQVAHGGYLSTRGLSIVGGTVAGAVAVVTVTGDDGLGHASTWYSNDVAVGGQGNPFSFARLALNYGGVVSLRSGSLLDIRSSGWLEGTGSIVGNVRNQASVTPGANIGRLNVNGNYNQTSSGSLVIELNGSSVGQYDQLQVSGEVTLAGTLSISAVPGYSPPAGSTFDILDWGSRSGLFASIGLPALSSGLTWDTSQLYSNGILKVMFPGDFNGNGRVDAADYVVWRDGLGTTYTQSDYSVWRSHFGQAAGSGTLLATVPEPASVWLLCAVALLISLANARRAVQS